tara:strand:- start:371 stop:553 length:183 start_codon:yes stop_codon:yes gene_type:complete
MTPWATDLNVTWRSKARTRAMLSKHITGRSKARKIARAVRNSKRVTGRSARRTKRMKSKR